MCSACSFNILLILDFVPLIQGTNTTAALLNVLWCLPKVTMIFASMLSIPVILAGLPFLGLGNECHNKIVNYPNIFKNTFIFLSSDADSRLHILYLVSWGILSLPYLLCEWFIQTFLFRTDHTRGWTAPQNVLNPCNSVGTEGAQHFAG